jgi:hypothetical protein
MDRVTRLGEFSNFRIFVYFWHFLKSTKVAQILGLPFFPQKMLRINVDKKLLGYILGDLFSQTHLVTLAMARMGLVRNKTLTVVHRTLASLFFKYPKY